LSIGYHGWGAEFVGATPPAWGVTPQDAVSLPFGNLGRLEDHFHVLDELVPAAIIVEAMPQDPCVDYWRELRWLCSHHGTLLILDEVVTGLSYALGGAAQHFGIEPDIICIG
jgi:glutamate-1-semialdehyde 2,1-aminomutase